MSHSPHTARTKSRMMRRHRVPRLPALRAAPFVVAGLIISMGLWAVASGVSHAVQKPTELLFRESSTLSKTPSQTWQEYEPHSRKYGTAVIAPELLAALAQVESAGNPLAQTYWKWHLTWHPFGLDRPASSAVGMYQITATTFARTSRVWRHEPAAHADGPGRGSCTGCIDGLDWS